MPPLAKVPSEKASMLSRFLAVGELLLGVTDKLAVAFLWFAVSFCVITNFSQESHFTSELRSIYSLVFVSNESKIFIGCDLAADMRSYLVSMDNRKHTS